MSSIINVNDPSLQNKEIKCCIDLSKPESGQVLITFRTIPKGKFTSLYQDIFDSEQSIAELKQLSEDLASQRPSTPQEIIERSNRRSEIREAAKELSAKYLTHLRSLISWSIVNVKGIAENGIEIKPEYRNEKWLNNDYSVLSEESITRYGMIDNFIQLLGHYSLLFQFNIDFDFNK